MTFDLFCDQVRLYLSNEGYTRNPDDDTLQNHFNEGYTVGLSARVFIDDWAEEERRKMD